MSKIYFWRITDDAHRAPSHGLVGEEDEVAMRQIFSHSKSIDKNKVVPLGKKWVSYSKKFFLAQNA